MQMVKANWPAPKNISAFTTTRDGGVSDNEFASLNLGNHVNDNPDHVAKNRELLQQQMHLPNSPAWLQQTHSTTAVKITNDFKICAADASYTDQANQVCAVMTADCLPVLICNQAGTEVAAIHAGWKGLADGVIEATIAKLQSKPSDLMAWLGPAIGPNVFEVGSDVYKLFLQHDAQATSGFTEHGEQKWLMDIYHLAQQRLNNMDITAIYGGDYCTYSDAEQFFSYRRDGQTGRMASVIWFG